MVTVAHNDEVSDSYDAHKAKKGNLATIIKLKKNFSPRLMNAMFVGMTDHNHGSLQCNSERAASVE